MLRHGAPTRTEKVYSTLRADILAGRQLPGSRLPFAELSARYQASMGVMREALTRLAAEGLVDAEPQHGFRVMPLSRSDLEHLTETRCLVEAAVIRQSTEHGDVAWESEVLAAHHRLQRTPQAAQDDPARLSEDWALAHRDFHHALSSSCPNPRLLGLAASLRDAAELYRRWSVPLGHERRDVAGEHRGLLDAVLAHDADAAADLLEQHIRHTTAVLTEQA
jgi:DNA-binding GntR family transcriptional regulator